MERIRIRPAHPGLIVRDPTTFRPLPAAGDEVTRSIFWERRLMDGDVVRVDVHAAPVGEE